MRFSPQTCKLVTVIHISSVSNDEKVCEGKIEGDTPISPGEHQIRMEFAYDGGGLGKGGTVTLYLDGKPVGTGRVDRLGTDGLLRRRQN
jgi:hypothetical protein